jgi:two-component system OmpR family sensor kinase
MVTGWLDDRFDDLRASSLRWRLALGYSLAVTLVLALLGTVEVWNAQSVLTDQVATSLRISSQAAIHDAEAVAWPAGRGPGHRAHFGTAPAALSVAAAQELAGEVNGGGSIGLVTDTAGNAVAATVPRVSNPGAGDTTIVRMLAETPGVRRAASGTGETALVVTAAQGSFMVVVTPLRLIRSGGAAGPLRGAPGAALLGTGASLRGHHISVVPGAVILAQSLSPVDAAVQRLLLATLGGTAVAILVATMLGALVVHRALRPLRRVAATADRITAGDLDQRAPLPGTHDEVGDLAIAFNRMLDYLDEAMRARAASEERMRRFAADASHELRTPLTAISGYTDVLLMGAKDDPPEADRVLHVMREEIRRMRRLVQDLLTLARLDEGQEGMRQEQIAVAPLLREVATAAAPLAGTRRVRIEVTDEDLLVIGDHDRLIQVLLNLLDNAIKFTRADGTICLRAAREGPAILIEVADDGVGIPPAHLGRVFERFYQSDTARNERGAGLGLAIVEAIVRAHGGTVQASSVLGHGTTISVRLPGAGIATMVPVHGGQGASAP